MLVVKKDQIASNKSSLFIYRSMKRFRNIALCIVIVTTLLIVGLGAYYKYQMSPVSKSEKIIQVEIPQGNVKQIARVLKEKNLIRDEKIFLIYVKIKGNANKLQAGYYELSQNLGVERIVELLEKGSKLNPNEISITFREGINMRKIAQVISNNTNNSYESVIEKSNDITYINKLINKYWFITEDIKNDELYYKLEGYLFPDTYRFKNKDVTVEEIFGKMLDEMDSVLSPYKETITKGNLTVHQVLTLASMVEKESYDNDNDRKNVASVFLNRIERGMSLGSDVTTRYAVKEDDNSKALTKVQFATKSPYNTRLTDGSMNGKLPVGPISTVSIGSLKAAIEPNKTDYIYFIANIKTQETFFFSNSKDFEAKKQELSSVNKGL